MPFIKYNFEWIRKNVTNIFWSDSSFSCVCKYRRILNSLSKACVCKFLLTNFYFFFLLISKKNWEVCEKRLIFLYIESKMWIPFSFSLIQCVQLFLSDWKHKERPYRRVRKWMMYAHHNCWHFFSVSFFSSWFCPKGTLLSQQHRFRISSIQINLSVIEPFSSDFCEFFSLHF